ncbi:hypothetical protein H7F15_15290 [Pontibacter sp. Tf4]|uniref:hypothetical protein n=1 Tax=Pontibacter sp. Tf4 TaxID=2761620 RepID=UPI00162A93C8|nr:hypothetical protein [Pontibacter sp. Tf4]MBB6612410.1 hypothetical protein [Pontibacter sp. Tf4]
MDLDKVQADFLRTSPKDIYMNYLQGNDVWYFSEYLKKPNYSKSYDDFKRFIASNLGVSFNNICVIGSCKLGYSLAPSKKFKTFDEDSDIDLVLVSNSYYNKFWDAYFDLYDQRANLDYKFIANNIFRRFVSIKNPEPIHPSLTDWISKVEKFNKDYQTLFDIKHEINYRIYDSWESVERYHIKGITEIQHQLRKTIQ